jgi:acetyltransferase-like isoleucine patch superfamily enzyme
MGIVWQVPFQKGGLVQLMGRISQYLSSTIFRIVVRVRTRVIRWWENHQIQEIRRLPNFECGAGVTIEGVPFVRIHKEASIAIGDGVTLNSNKAWSLVGAYGPVVLFADHPGAKIRIGARTRFHASCIRAYNSVMIGSRCLIASNCQIMDASGHSLSFNNVERRIDDVIMDSKPVVIEDDVWLCEGVKVLPGVTIGKGSVVGAGSVVTKSLPPYCLAAGIPAKVVRQANE